MVRSSKPGIYVPDQRGVPKKYRNIGVRIEDDVAVTADGYEILSKAVPVDPDEIEQLVGSRIG